MKNIVRFHGFQLAAVVLLAAVPAAAQYDPAPRLLAPQELDNLVSRIALYPDPLLAQVLAAATFPGDVPEAARWAYDHRSLRENDLANAIADANLPWDPSLQSLLPFPDVLDTMARDMNWTAELGDAFLAQRDDVMEAVQRMRRQAQAYGYLHSGDQVRVVDEPGYIQIVPYNPAVIYVPVYDPYVVYAPPRPGFYVGSAIGFSHGFVLGAAFGHWGWGGGFDWRRHTVIVHDRVWDRNWSNRRAWVNNSGNWNNRQYRREPDRTVVIDNHNGNGYRPAPPPANHRDNGGNAYRATAPAVQAPAQHRESVGNAFRPTAPAKPPARIESPVRHENVRRDPAPTHATPARESRGMDRSR